METSGSKLLDDQTFQFQQMLAARYNLYSSSLSTKAAWDTSILHKDTGEGVSMSRPGPVLYRRKPDMSAGGGWLLRQRDNRWNQDAMAVSH